MHIADSHSNSSSDNRCLILDRLPIEIRYLIYDQLMYEDMFIDDEAYHTVEIRRVHAKSYPLTSLRYTSRQTYHEIYSWYTMNRRWVTHKGDKFFVTDHAYNTIYYIEWTHISDSMNYFGKQYSDYERSLEIWRRLMYPPRGSECPQITNLAIDIEFYKTDDSPIDDASFEWFVSNLLFRAQVLHNDVYGVGLLEFLPILPFAESLSLGTVVLIVSPGEGVGELPESLEDAERREGWKAIWKRLWLDMLNSEREEKGLEWIKGDAFKWPDLKFILRQENE